MLAVAMFDRVGSKVYLYAIAINEATAMILTEIETWWRQGCTWHDSKLIIEQ